MAAKKNTVPFFLYPDHTQPDTKFRPVGVNGKITLVPYGKQVDLDPAVVEVLQNAMKASQKAMEKAEEVERVYKETLERPLQG